jgi:glycosyltransferase involved in cell wall biosynthesis
MSGPDISVIVPVYNAKKWLSGCLDSLLAQTFASLEMLLVNDGSTDGSGELCRRYAEKDSRIRLYTQSNQGIISARNRALRLSVGRYIAFVDNDDRVNANYFEALFRAAEENKADIAYCDVGLLKNGRIAATTRYDQKLRISLEERVALIQEEFYPAPWGKIYRRELIRDNKLRFLAMDGYPGFCEDIIFALNTIHVAGKIVFAPGAVYFWNRDNASSVCADPGKQGRNNRHRLLVVRHLLDFARGKKFSPAELTPVLRAVENHLRWGGEKTVRKFMRELPESPHSREVKDYFLKFAESYYKEYTFARRCKDWIKSAASRFPGLYRMLAAINASRKGMIPL